MSRPTDKQIIEIIECSIDDIFLQIQDLIDQDDGGVASIFYSGKQKEVNDFLLNLMNDYLNVEEAYTK